MWWLFENKSQMSQGVSPGGECGDNGSSGTAGQAAGDQNLSRAKKKTMEAYLFDSSALERAAEAARTSERSRFQALELSKLQEETRQQEYMVMAKEYEVHIEQSKVELKRFDHEERRKTFAEETKQQQQRTQY